MSKLFFLDDRDPFLDAMTAVKFSSLFLAFGLLGLGHASNGSSVTFPAPVGYSTKVYNVSAATTTISYSYSNEELALLWDQVGSIAVGPITTTVSPTPEPTLYPRPGIFHPPVSVYYKMSLPLPLLLESRLSGMDRFPHTSPLSTHQNSPQTLNGVLRPPHIK